MYFKMHITQSVRIPSFIYNRDSQEFISFSSAAHSGSILRWPEKHLPINLTIDKQSLFYTFQVTMNSSMSERRGCVRSTAKSLNTLRQLLQTSINEEIDDVIQKYIKKYLEPAIENIEFNQRAGIIPTNGMPPKQYIKAVCRQILDEAKKMY